MSGALDFSQSDRFSLRWEIKRDIVLEQLETDNLLKLKMMRHLQHASAAAYGDDNRYEHHFSEAAVELTTVGGLLFPWIDWKKTEKSDEYQQLWEQFYGIKVGSKEWEALERRGELMLKMRADKEAARANQVR